MLVIHGAHRTSPRAAGIVPRRPACASDIEHPLLGDVHSAEQLHASVPSAHMLLVPSHSNVTLSATPSKHARCNACMHVYIFSLVHACVEYSLEHAQGPQHETNSAPMLSGAHVGSAVGVPVGARTSAHVQGHKSACMMCINVHM